MAQAQGYRQQSASPLQGTVSDAQHRLRIEQAHPPHAAHRIQEVPGAQRARAGGPAHAEPRLLRRDRPRRLLQEAQGDCRARQAAVGPPHQPQRSPAFSRERVSLRFLRVLVTWSEYTFVNVNIPDF
uniref:IP17707p n=1 Tax=Drosophila melanogaster TaxID=7227 RepID=A2VEI8_DROME|nr:IP17707p [Drosophila melanogaster]